MKNETADRIRIQHILVAIEEIESYISGATFNDFKKNSMMRFACIKQLEIIGEAANHLRNEIKIRFPQVSWKEVIGLRNLLIHEYFGID